jgi:protein-S-isoprenylcysteine O-methyltransferase Ste14
MADHPTSRIQLLRESWRRFGEVLPEMQRPSSVALVWGGAVLVQVPCLLIGSSVARALPSGAILVQSILLSWAGAFMYFGFWRHRAVYRQRYGQEAYRHLFFRFLLPFIVGGSAAILFPAFIEGERLLPPAIAYTLAVYLLLTMQLIEARGTDLFWDVEWRAFVYNVFPERGRFVTAGIFDQLRHPIYSAAIRMTLGLALLRNNLDAILCAVIIALGLWVWSNVEERDLQRKDTDYATYRHRVPAFFAVPPLRFWRYLATGRDAQ